MIASDDPVPRAEYERLVRRLRLAGAALMLCSLLLLGETILVLARPASGPHFPTMPGDVIGPRTPVPAYFGPQTPSAPWATPAPPHGGAG